MQSDRNKNEYLDNIGEDMGRSEQARMYKAKRERPYLGRKQHNYVAQIVEHTQKHRSPSRVRDIQFLIQKNFENRQN